MEKGLDYYICTYVNNNKNTSKLNKIIIIKNNEKDMSFIDNKLTIWQDGVLPIGTVKEVTYNIK